MRTGQIVKRGGVPAPRICLLALSLAAATGRADAGFERTLDPRVVQRAVLAREQQPNVKDKSIIVQAEVLAARAESEYLTAALDHLLALSALERITAGGIRPAFPGR